MTVSILESGNYRLEATTNEILYQEALKGTSSHSLAQNCRKSLEISGLSLGIKYAWLS